MCLQWFNEKIKKLTCMDYGVLKVCVFTFALLLAKFWPNILSLDWYWYAAVFAVTYAYLIIRVFAR